MKLWRLVLYNLLRKPGRSLGAVLGVVLAAGTLFAGGLISMGVNHAVGVGMARLGADLMVVPRQAATATHTALVVGEPAAFYMDGAVTAKVAAIPGVERVSPQVFVETLASSACCTGRLLLIGFDPATDFTVQPWLNQQLGRPLEPHEILVGNHVLGLPGEPMTFYGSEFTVADRLDPTGMGIDESVFLPASAVATIAANSAQLAEKPLEIPAGHVSSVLVRLAEPEQAANVARQIEAEIPGVAVVTRGQVTDGVSRDLSGLMAWVMPVAGGVLVVALLLFLVLFSAIASERQREIGLFRAMGATARQAVAALIGEAVLLGVLGGLLGVAAGLGVYSIFSKRILVSYVLPFLWPTAPEQMGLALIILLGTGALGALAAAVPALRIARMEPHLAIHGAPR